MTAEVKTIADPQALADYVQDLYDGGSTTVTVTVLKPAVYLIQYN